MVMPVTVERTVTENAEALLWSVVERAVTAMVACGGTARGAVNMVAAPLAVCAGEKLPQFAALPQVAIQSTPAFAGSFVTVADTCTELPTVNMVGGSCISATDMTGVCDKGLLAGLVEQPASPQRATRLKASEARP